VRAARIARASKSADVGMDPPPLDGQIPRNRSSRERKTIWPGRSHAVKAVWFRRKIIRPRSALAPGNSSTSPWAREPDVQAVYQGGSLHFMDIERPGPGPRLGTASWFHTRTRAFLFEPAWLPTPCATLFSTPETADEAEFRRPPWPDAHFLPRAGDWETWARGRAGPGRFRANGLAAGDRFIPHRYQGPTTRGFADVACSVSGAPRPHPLTPESLPPPTGSKLPVAKQLYGRGWLALLRAHVHPPSYQRLWVEFPPGGGGGGLRDRLHASGSTASDYYEETPGKWRLTWPAGVRRPANPMQWDGYGGAKCWGFSLPATGPGRVFF